MRDCSAIASICRYAVILMVLAIGGCKTPQSMKELVQEIETVASKVFQIEESASDQSPVYHEQATSQAGTTVTSGIGFLDNPGLCDMAVEFSPNRGWSTLPVHSPHVQEAKRRGLTPDTCFTLAANELQKGFTKASNSPSEIIVIDDRLTNKEVCDNALFLNKTNWSKLHFGWISEAVNRGFTLGRCAELTSRETPLANSKSKVITDYLYPLNSISSKYEVPANLKNLKASNSCVGCSFKKANLEGENLQGAKLSQTIMQGTNLRGANLRGADFQNADLWGTNLEQADLQEANFRGAMFMQTNLRGANLKGANFQDADLRFVNFDGAILEGANFQGAKLFGTEINEQQASIAKSPNQSIKQLKKSMAQAGQSIKQLKKLMAQAGYEILDQPGNDPGPGDGVKGESNRVANRGFQKDQKLTGSGEGTHFLPAKRKIAAKREEKTKKSLPSPPSSPAVEKPPILQSEISKKSAKDQQKKIASLPPQIYQAIESGGTSRKRGAKKDELRPVGGVATAIQIVGNDGSLLAGFRRGQLTLLNLSNGKIIRNFRGHTGTIRAIAIHPDGLIAASGADDKEVRLWKLKSGTAIGVLKGHTDKILSLTFTGDGKHLLSGGGDGTVRVWEVSSKKLTRVLEVHRGGVGAIVTLPGKPIVLSASNSAKDRSTIKIWNYKNGVPLGSLRGHRAPVYSLVVSPDGTRLISGSGDKTIKIWDIKQNKPINTFGIIDGHRGAIRSLVMAMDGRFLVSGADDHTVIVWNAQTGDIVRKIREHKGKIKALALSHDGKSVVSSSKDKSIKIWRLVGDINAASN